MDSSMGEKLLYFRPPIGCAMQIRWDLEVKYKIDYLIVKILQ
jgi:hypothetical protein